MKFHAPLPDHYHSLGVSEHSSCVEIREAFLGQAKRFHPDLNKSADAKEAFNAASEAYFVLRDEQRRRIFDATRSFEARRTEQDWAWRSRCKARIVAGVALAAVLGTAILLTANIKISDEGYGNEAADRMQLALLAASFSSSTGSAVRPGLKETFAAATASATKTISEKIDAPCLAATVHLQLLKQASAATAEIRAPVSRKGAPPTAKRAVTVATPPNRTLSIQQIRYARAVYAATQASRMWKIRKQQLAFRQRRRA